MGRKSHAKPKKNHDEKDASKIQKESNKEKAKTIQRKRELNDLVDKLLRLTSVFQPANNRSKSWEHYLEIYSILQKVINLEKLLNSEEKIEPKQSRQSCVDDFLKWMRDQGSEFDGIGISEFEGYDMGLKALKNFEEGSLMLVVPRKVMMSEKDAIDSELGEFIAVDPLLQNMPNVTLALYLLLQKGNEESIWKPYIQVLPQKYTTVLYFSSEEMAELRNTAVIEQTLTLYRSIARQYTYFYNKIFSSDMPVLRKLKNIFTYENYRWAVSTVMTRQNHLQILNANITAFIPLWDMCNHEHGKVTTSFNAEFNQGECYALRNFKAGEQIFIFYGARPNSDLFLHNGFVYPTNMYDSLTLTLGISPKDPLHDTKMALLSKLGLARVTHYNIFNSATPITPELLAFVRIFNMNGSDLEKWSKQNVPSDLVSDEVASSDEVGRDINGRAYNYLLIRCSILLAAYDNKKAVRDVLDRVNNSNDITTDVVPKIANIKIDGNESTPNLGKDKELPDKSETVKTTEKTDKAEKKNDIKHESNNTVPVAENTQATADEIEIISLHRKNIQLLKECEMQILTNAIEYLKKVGDKVTPNSNSIN